MRCATVSSSSENTCVHCVVNSIGVYRNLHPRPPVSRAPPCKYLIQPVSIKCSIIFIYENAIGEQKEETNQRNIVYCVPMRTYPLILLHFTLINSPFFSSFAANFLVVSDDIIITVAIIVCCCCKTAHAHQFLSKCMLPALIMSRIAYACVCYTCSLSGCADMLLSMSIFAQYSTSATSNKPHQYNGREAS